MPRGIVALTGRQLFAQQIDQCCWLDGLGEVQVKPGCQGTRLVARLSPAGDGNQQGIPDADIETHAPRHFETVEPRHSDVEQRNLRPQGLDIFQRLLSVLGLPTAPASALVDWIDADSEPQPQGGAEDATYLALQSPYLAANSARFPSP